MSHELDFQLGNAAMAYVGQTPWHKLGTRIDPDANLTVEDWMKVAHMDWAVEKKPIFMQDAQGGLIEIPNKKAIIRSDTGHVFNVMSDGFEATQNAEIFAFMNEYVLCDERFKMETCGSLKDGASIWALARFESQMTVAGDQHDMFCLLSTAHDGTKALTAQSTTVRVVCWNTLSAAQYDKQKVVCKMRHTSKFDETKRAGFAAQLSEIVQSAERYKEMGDALAQQHATANEVGSFIRELLDLPTDKDDYTTQQRNKRDAMIQALQVTANERAHNVHNLDRFDLLNAVTRYVDHDTRGKADVEQRLYRAQFGTGAQLKKKAVDLLTA